MKRLTRKLNPREEETVAAQETTRKQETIEFKGPDELIRYDTAHTIVPANIARRLKKSTRGLPGPSAAPSWWRRLLFRKR